MNNQPSIQILATCPNGHQTFWFPERVLVSYSGGENENRYRIEWECPVCPKDGYKHEVELW